MVHPPLDIMTEVSLPDQVLNLVLQVSTLFGVVVVFTVKIIVSALVPFFGSGLDAVRWCHEPLPSYLEEDLDPRGVERSYLAEVWPLYPPPRWSRGRSPRLFPQGCFCSSHFPTIRASAVMKWFSLCIISGTMVGGFSTKDQNSLDGRMPIRKAWMTKEGCASGIARDSVANLLTNCARGSSLPWAMSRSEAIVGLGRALARKFCSSSLASWSKEIMVVGWRRSYHTRAGPLKVVGKTRHISASDESYNAICARKAATCSVGFELPSYDSKTDSLKLAGTGLSRISGAKGDLCLELSAASSCDLMTSFWTSSRRSFTRQSFTRNELVESDDKVLDPERFGLGRVPPMLKSGFSSSRSKKGPPSGDRVSEHLYLRRRVGHTRVTSLLQDLTGHQPPIVGGVVHWSAAAPALTRRLLPAAMGYYSPVGHCACPDTPPVASCQGIPFVEEPTPDLSIGGTRPSPNRSARVFCWTSRRLTRRLPGGRSGAATSPNPRRRSSAHENSR
ncbi:hypothetical protein BHE74_00002321 [Ensete ventricosum]|nr:hypothetical protein BHE74_00002321 [Ensete ventricosum]